MDKADFADIASCVKGMQFVTTHDDSLPIYSDGHAAASGGGQPVPVLMDDQTPTAVSLHF